jgi:hypothetical protein
MAQTAEHLPCKHEVPTLNSSTVKKKFTKNQIKNSVL